MRPHAGRKLALYRRLDETGLGIPGVRELARPLPAAPSGRRLATTRKDCDHGYI